MVNRHSAPTSMFWNCLGISLVVLSTGMAWAITRTKVFELEIAQYKLKTGNAISKVLEVSNTLEKSAKSLPLENKQQEQIEKTLAESNAVIDKATSAVNDDVELLIEP